MAVINIKRQHTLGCSEARRRVEEVANSLQSQLHAEWTWDGDTLNFKRSGASGSVAVGDDYVEFKIKLGMLLSPMKGSIEKAIDDRIDNALS